MKRGIRNNNPLNIRRTQTVWKGMKKEVTDKEFVEFKSMAYGYRAAWRILFNYFYRFLSMKMPFTVSTIIDRWAPPTENPTKAYIDQVLKLTGMGGNERLYPPYNELGVWKLSSLLAAMTVVECGIPPEEVDTEAIKKGYTLAFDRPFHTETMDEEDNNSPQDETNVIWDEYWDWSPMAYNGD